MVDTAITIQRVCSVWGFEAPAGCEKCSATDGYLARLIQANGYTQIRWVCGWCEGYQTRGALPHRILSTLGWQLDDLPIRKDNSAAERELPCCSVCDRPGDHAHHWAPSAIFDDWPWHLTVPLCVEHHQEWHQRMRDHGLRWPHELEQGKKAQLDEEWYVRTVLDAR